MKLSLRKILLTVGASAVLITAISAASSDSGKPQEQAQNPEGQNAAESVSDPAFIIGIYKGYVAVYEYGSDEPIKITDIPVITLTNGDALILAKGIEVADEQELNKRLEDYTG